MKARSVFAGRIFPQDTSVGEVTRAVDLGRFLHRNGSERGPKRRGGDTTTPAACPGRPTRSPQRWWRTDQGDSLDCRPRSLLPRPRAPGVGGSVRFTKRVAGATRPRRGELVRRWAHPLFFRRGAFGQGDVLQKERAGLHCPAIAKPPDEPAVWNPRRRRASLAAQEPRADCRQSRCSSRSRHPRYSRPGDATGRAQLFRSADEMGTVVDVWGTGGFAFDHWPASSVWHGGEDFSATPQEVPQVSWDLSSGQVTELGADFSVRRVNVRTGYGSSGSADDADPRRAGDANRCPSTAAAELGSR